MYISFFDFKNKYCYFLLDCLSCTIQICHIILKPKKYVCPFFLSINELVNTSLPQAWNLCHFITYVTSRTAINKLLWKHMRQVMAALCLDLFISTRKHLNRTSEKWLLGFEHAKAAYKEELGVKIAPELFPLKMCLFYKESQNKR